MNLEDFYTFCLSKKGVTEHFPFDNDTLVFKVATKIFVLTSIKQWESGNPAMNLKCNPEKAIELREQYNCIEAGYHMNKKHWNTIHLTDELSDSFLKELINDSYELVLNSLDKKTKASIV